MSLFGTDGIRFTIDKLQNNPELFQKIGLGMGKWLTNNTSKKKVIIGKDTRDSCDEIIHLISSGLRTFGIDVTLVGVMTSPAVSFLVEKLEHDCGIMVTASHNDARYNGIKVFNRDGSKLSIENQIAINSAIDSLDSDKKIYHSGALIDHAGLYDDAYIQYILESVQSFKMNGIKIILDTAHGAAYKIARVIFEKLGCQIIQIGDNPDGLNINQNCGATNYSVAQNLLLMHKADYAVILDGDGDRIVMIDKCGNYISGDHIIGLLAMDMFRKGVSHQEKKAYVVGTIISNGGLERYLKNIGVHFIRTAVGDQNVYRAMLDHSAQLGGESCGHIILNKYGKSGDGILVAVLLLNILITRYRDMNDLRIFGEIEQVSHNININFDIDKDRSAIEQDLMLISESINIEGVRSIIRLSGTEPLIRVMIEGNNAQNILTNALEQIEVVIKAYSAT